VVDDDHATNNQVSDPSTATSIDTPPSNPLPHGEGDLLTQRPNLRVGWLFQEICAEYRTAVFAGSQGSSFLCGNSQSQG